MSIAFTHSGIKSTLRLPTVSVQLGIPNAHERIQFLLHMLCCSYCGHSNGSIFPNWISESCPILVVLLYTYSKRHSQPMRTIFIMKEGKKKKNVSNLIWEHEYVYISFSLQLIWLVNEWSLVHYCRHCLLNHTW